MNAALTLASWLDLVASVVLAGGLAWGLLVARISDTGRRVLGPAAVTLIVALALEFTLTAVRMHEVSEISGLALVGDLARTRWGQLWVWRLLGVGVLALVGRSARPPAAAGVLALPWLLLRSFQGHPGAHGTVPAIIDWLHLAAASVWIGGLLQLRLSGAAGDAALALRFRRVATGALALLVPAGIYGAFLHVPSVATLVESPYGRTLLAKLVLVAALVALGGANHFRLVPAIAAATPGAAGRLMRNVRAELALAAVVLLLSALLGVLPMPHALP